MRTHIIYIPGLGSGYNTYRRAALKFWCVYGVSAELVEIDWYDNKSFDQKMEQVNAAIAKCSPRRRLVLIGESAGATLALHAAAIPSVSRVITLCGVTQPTMPISLYLQKKSPEFVQATRSIPDTTRFDVRSIRAVVDHVINKKYTTATGARSYTFWAVGHVSTIIACVTVLAPLMVTIAKKSKT